MGSAIGQFFKFFLVWYSQQFAIPFWIVGHVHLHIASYDEGLEIAGSVVMHLMVLAGFWLDWRDYRNTPR